MYTTQNYWVSGLCPSSAIINNYKTTFSETGCRSETMDDVQKSRNSDSKSQFRFRESSHGAPINPWPESVSYRYRPSDRRLPAKLVPTFADRGCHVVSVTDPYGRILGFLYRAPIHIYLLYDLSSVTHFD
jgi:hypothetical protein